jgi:hypothetical protein
MIITPPSSGNVRKIAESAPRVRRGRVQLAPVPEIADTTVRSSA